MDRLNNWLRSRPEILSAIGYFLVRLIGMTLRVSTVGAEKCEKLEKSIICGWHGRSFIFANYFRKRGYWVIISHSRDGEVQTQIFQKLGYHVIRGSTGRGGVRAAVEGIRALRQGGTMAITPDGPRGPSGVVQGGVMLMAQKSGAALIPTGITARPRRLAKSWDRYLIPFPFARCVMLFGDPIFVPTDLDEAGVEERRLELEREIHRLEKEVEALVGNHL